MPAERMSYVTCQSNDQQGIDRVEAHQVKSLLALSYLREDLFDLLERAQIASFPFDLRVLTAFFLDLPDGLFTLLFLAIDHDHSRSVLHERSGDFEAAL
jgi:hypothetical protein